MERLDVQDQFISSIQSPNLHFLKNQCLHFNSSEPIVDEEMDRCSRTCTVEDESYASTHEINEVLQE